jgi:predicted HTH domain antitoxin
MSGLDSSAGPPASPGDSIGDPFSPLTDQFDDLGAVLGLVYDDPQQWLARLVDELLALPPEERFTDAVAVLEEEVTEEFGSMDAFQARLPGISPDRARQFMLRLLDRLITETLRGVWFGRDPEPHLVVVAGYAGALHGIDQFDETDDEQVRAVFSALFAYFARLYALGIDGESSDPTDEDRAELVRDVARTIWHVERAVDGEASFVDDPEAATDKQLRERVRGFGAVLAYSRLDISVGRGAELAGLSRPAFEARLEEYDVEPRFGPDSVAELYDGPDATDTDTDGA